MFDIITIKIPQNMKYLNSSILLFCLLLLVGCSSSSESSSSEKDSTDSVDVDTSTISEEFYSENTENNDYVYEEEEELNPPSHRSSGGGHYGTGEDYDISKYENYERTGNSPKDFAQAMVLPIIRMVYEENFKNAKAKVLNADLKDGRHSIDILVKWSDRWVDAPYEVEGVLEVNEDGTQVEYIVTKKNGEAEALEFTNENFKSDLTLDQI